ncbi:MAG: hypothetical protein KDI27_05720 [Gammaproteobacteria bacterium]|nr:hypothetical protein [Gammaproteobacteria bacterium]MCP5417024.1 hypothetical protein [Chromatiaceae bacterium]
MINNKQEVFTFRGATPEQVDDLCELWKECVIGCNRQHGFVQVISDAEAVDQFLLFYELYNYLEQDTVSSVEANSTSRYH